MALMVMAIEFSGDPFSATSTITVTESVCMTGSAEQATPLSVANALATAADASAAASVIASMMADSLGGDTIAPRPTMNTTMGRTVTAMASATNCPSPPSFDLSPSGLFAHLLSDKLGNTPADNTDAKRDEAPAQAWSKGRQSLCLTTSSWVGTGWYAIYLDGWGQEKDGCGKGALDNLRGQCNDVWHWGCKPWGSSGVLLTFYLPAVPIRKCALDAMWLASPSKQREEGLCCVFLGDPWLASNQC